jgi:hypothetical protein
MAGSDHVLTVVVMWKSDVEDVAKRRVGVQEDASPIKQGPQCPANARFPLGYPTARTARSTKSPLPHATSLNFPLTNIIPDRIVLKC